MPGSRPRLQDRPELAVQGARVDHHTIGLFNELSTPITGLKFENILGVTNDTGADPLLGQLRRRKHGDLGGIALYREETVVYDDAHVVASSKPAGQHQLVAGAALTWGKTTAEGHGFDFAFQIDPQWSRSTEHSLRRQPELQGLADLRRPLRQRRVDAGQWFTLTFGGRYDFTRGAARLPAGDRGPEFDEADERATSTTWSGARHLPHVSTARRAPDRDQPVRRRAAQLQAGRAEPDRGGGREILEPETTNTRRPGSRRSGSTARLSFNVTWFHMISATSSSGLTPDGPGPTNAGKVRFQGTEVEIGYALPFLGAVALRRLRAPDARFKIHLHHADGE